MIILITQETQLQIGSYKPFAWQIEVKKKTWLLGDDATARKNIWLLKFSHFRPET